MIEALDTARVEIARRTARGVGMPAAGIALWLAMAQFGQMFPPEKAAVASFMATGAVFPLGWWLTRLAGGDLMFKLQPLTQLGMLLNFIQLAYWPVLIVVFLRDPMLVPFVFAVLFGSHFLPYGWLYRSRAYTLLGIGMPVLGTTMQIAAPAHAFTAIPLASAALYALAVGLLLRENAVDRAAGADVAKTSAAPSRPATP